jgi:hypothetical protein
VSTGKFSRGHPVVALLAVLGGWVGGRAATWEAPTAVALQAPAAAPAPGPQSLPGQPPDFGAEMAPTYRGEAYPGVYLARGKGRPVAYASAAYPGRAYPGYVLLPSPQRDEAGWALADRGGRAGVYPAPGLREDFASFEPLPRFFAPESPGGASGAAAPAAPLPRPLRNRRWSLDVWALLRRDNTDAPSSPGRCRGRTAAARRGWSCAMR